MGELSVSTLSHLCSGSLLETTSLKVRPGEGNVSNLFSYRTDVDSCFKKQKRKQSNLNFNCSFKNILRN